MDAVGPGARAQDRRVQQWAKRAQRIGGRGDLAARQFLRESSVHPPVPLPLLLGGKLSGGGCGVNSIRM
jgi:hypothetical protein